MDCIKLMKRTEENVSFFWEKTRDKEIRRLFPLEEVSIEKALEMFHQQRKDDSKSYGRCIYTDKRYIGDIWCYAINPISKSAFVSILIFDKASWNKGIGTKALDRFIQLIRKKYALDHLMAYTYAFNQRAFRCFEKNHFDLRN